MTREKIEKSITICDFMEWSYNLNEFNGNISLEDDNGINILFLSDWNRLIEVVEAIEEIGDVEGFLVTIRKNYCKIEMMRQWAMYYEGDWENIEKASETKTEAVFNACFIFSEWYLNKQSNGN
jgi:hypothetical protein